MNLRKAERRQAKIRLALQGPAGSGKTYSSLLIAYGITGDWSKIVVIDTENSSADLYTHLGIIQCPGNRLHHFLQRNTLRQSRLVNSKVWR